MGGLLLVPPIDELGEGAADVSRHVREGGLAVGTAAAGLPDGRQASTAVGGRGAATAVIQVVGGRAGRPRRQAGQQRRAQPVQRGMALGLRIGAGDPEVGEGK